MLESFEWMKGVGDIFSSQLQRCRCPTIKLAQRISSLPFEMQHSEGPIDLASFEHFSLEQPFNIAAMSDFNQNCLPEVNLSCLKHI